MSILCGTDFSSDATAAVRVASLLARASGQRLHLIHVLTAAVPQPGAAAPPEREGPARQRLELEAARLATLGIAVDPALLGGRPDEALVERAHAVHAELVVVGAVGHRPIERWMLGSCAERTAREAPMPVLVVREARAFEEWLRNGRALRVVVGCEAGPSSDKALEWAGTLASFGPIELHVTRMVLAGEENRRVGASGPGMGITLSADAETGLIDQLRDRTRAVLGDLTARIKVFPGFGRIDRQLVLAAEELGGDLIVVGSHQREGFRRWWHGSVSSGVLHAAPMSVAVVPLRIPSHPAAEPETAHPATG
jgi:nucleotide-binding universal stress UspA family protein